MGSEDFLEGIRRVQAGDQAVEEALLRENMPLVAAIARRYQNCGLAQEDMIQLGSIGLLQALRRFDPTRGLCFSTYAVPLIAGEIRRFLRDDGMVKFSREAKSLALQIERVRREQGERISRRPWPPGRRPSPWTRLRTRTGPTCRPFWGATALTRSRTP